MSGAATHETLPRIAVRSLTWRTGGVLLTIFLTWLFSGGDIVLGVEVGIVYNVIRYFTHLVHDWAWSHVSWGYRHDAPGPKV